ncbi:hypothetical protein D4764_17G0003940 [Scomber scombrus]|uniref:Uncharacterized protein n=1 Tax=Scomber scombrus TaxID=13677 RepID=A0AAV1PN05_SCOSC
MESPHHGALDPGSHPRTATEAAHSGAYGHCNTIQMYSTVRVDVCRGLGYFHYCRKIHSNPSTLSANDMQSQRTLGFNSEGR